MVVQDKDDQSEVFGHRSEWFGGRHNTLEERTLGTPRRLMTFTEMDDKCGGQASGEAVRNVGLLRILKRLSISRTAKAEKLLSTVRLELH